MPSAVGQYLGGASSEAWDALYVNDLMHGEYMGTASYLGFFGDAGETKITVANVSAFTTSVADVRDKLNELIDALQGYGQV